MARRRKKTTSLEAQPAAPTAALPSQAPAAAAWSTGAWIRTYAVVFAVAETAVVLLFSDRISGDSKVRLEMLHRAESFAAAGEYEKTLAVYDAYGKRWPGAYGTQNFEKRLGDTYARLGIHEEAADHYEKSVKAYANVQEMRALAGEEWWKAGSKERAVNLFRAELMQGDPENDLAHRYLGLDALEQNKVVDAMRHFRAVEGEWPAEIKQARDRIEKEVIAPCRERAKKRADDLKT